MQSTSRCLLHTIAGRFSLKDRVPAAVTTLNLQLDDKSLPQHLVKQICELKHITELDLSGCSQLEVLPAAFAAYGVGRRLKVLQLPPLLDGALPDASGKEWSPQRKLAAILLRQQRRQAILKLATQQEPMLTTLERMSWLLIILATITLTAFLQPGMKAAAAGNVTEVDANECRANAIDQFFKEVEPVNQTLARDPDCACDSYFGCADNQQPNLTSSNQDIVDAACFQLEAATVQCYDKLGKINRVAAFALLTVLSFCVTLVCLMLIVVVSLPRLKCTDLAYEAGRLWLFLLIIWLLFVEAVQLAFLSFWAFAVVVYDQAVAPWDVEYSDYVVYVPWQFRRGLFWATGISGVSMAILATALLTIPALILVCVFFASIYPGHRAVHLACCSCTCLGPTQDFVDSYSNRDVEEGKQGIFVSACPPAIIKVE